MNAVIYTTTSIHLETVSCLKLAVAFAFLVCFIFVQFFCNFIAINKCEAINVYVKKAALKRTREGATEHVVIFLLNINKQTDQYVIISLQINVNCL